MPICKASRSVVAWHRVGSGRTGPSPVAWIGQGRLVRVGRSFFFSGQLLSRGLLEPLAPLSAFSLSTSLAPCSSSLSLRFSCLSVSLSVLAALSCGNPSWAGNISFLVVAKQELVVAVSSSLQKQWRSGRLSLLKSTKPLV